MQLSLILLLVGIFLLLLLLLAEIHAVVVDLFGWTLAVFVDVVGQYF